MMSRGGTRSWPSLADDLGDDVRRDLERELLADRALQVAELDHADLGLRVAEHEAVLGEPLELVVHQRDVGDVTAGPGPAARCCCSGWR